VKMRSSRHATDIRRYTIGTSGAIVADAEDCSRSVLTGLPILTSGEARTLSGLTADEVTLLHSLRALGASAARELSRRTGLKGVTLSRALARLQQLEYVRTVRRAGVVLYRALS
jgi:DNA-binding transcriptional ArsR family regulator